MFSGILKSDETSKEGHMAQGKKKSFDEFYWWIPLICLVTIGFAAIVLIETRGVIDVLPEWSANVLAFTLFLLFITNAAIAAAFKKHRLLAGVAIGFVVSLSLLLVDFSA